MKKKQPEWSRDIRTFRQRTHRSLSDAFRGAEYACAIERDTGIRAQIETILGVIVICCVGLMFGAALAWMI